MSLPPATKLCDLPLNFQRGWSPLMEAARGGFKDIVEELAKRGVDLDMRTVRIKI